MYELPQFLKGSVSERQYRRWLFNRAAAHVRRDRNHRGNPSARGAGYRVAIHKAVLNSDGIDAYTGLPLRWDQMGSYDNEESKARGREYNKERGDSPNVDHVGDGRGEPEFRICSSRTNKAKSDLTYEEFLSLCQSVLAHSRKR